MATPKKTAAPKKAASSTPKVVRFPKKELNAWLKSRASWNHEDWLALLAELGAAGFGTYTETAEGQNTIGMYLEANRKSV